MAFKSYAKGGNYGTYNVLPIGKEINEDLRAANQKVQDIQLTAQAKANHAQEYISALNNKFKVEHQNRDDNDKFFQNNHKRIYEGEQRQLEGEMAELRRRHAEEAQKEAEPSVLEKALPHILSLVKVGAGMIAETAAAQTQAEAEQVEVLSANIENNGGNIGKLYQTHQSILDPAARGDWMLNQAHALAPQYGGDHQKALDALNLAFASGKPEIMQVRQTYALQAGQNAAGFDTMAAQSTTLAPHLFGTDYKRHRDETRKFYRTRLLEHVGKDYYNQISDAVKIDGYKAQNKFLNQVMSNSMKVFGQAGEDKFYGEINGMVNQAYSGQNSYTGMSKAEAYTSIIEGPLMKSVAGSPQQEQRLEAVQLFLRATDTNPQVSSNDLQDVFEHMNANNPGKYLNNQVNDAFREAIDKKLTQEHKAWNQQNNVKRIESQQVLDQFYTYETPSEQRAFMESIPNLKTLHPSVQKEMMAAIAGHTNVAKEKSSTVESLLRMSLQTDMASRTVQTHLAAEFEKFKTFDVTDAQINAVRVDALRILPSIIGKDIDGFERNPGEFFQRALNEAMKEQTWSVQGDGVKGTVTLKGAESQNQKVPFLERDFGRVNWGNPGKRLEETVNANPGHKADLSRIADKINLRFEQNTEPMTYQELANTGILNHTFVETAYRTAISTNPNISRSWIAMHAIQAASDDTVPNIVSAVATPQDVALARTAGVTAIPHSSSVSQALYAGTPISNSPYVIQTTSYVPSTGPGTDAQHSGSNMHEHAGFPESSQAKQYMQAVRIADQRRGGGVYRITSTFRADDHGSDHSKGSMENPFAVDVAPNLDLPYTQEAETAWRNQFHADLNAVYDEKGWPKPDFILRGNR